MRLLTFHSAQGLQLGLKTDSGILDVARAAAVLRLPAPLHVTDALQGRLGELASLAEAAQGRAELFHAEESIRFGPCVPNPPKILCIGLNYRKHAQEAGMEVPAFPLLFSKFSQALAAHGDEIALPPDSSQVDYEAEMAIVIGQTARNLSEAEALSCVGGYCSGNDITARDLQFRTSQWLLGKTCDGFNPIGPYLVTADEVADPDNLRVQCWVNGEQRQDSTTADMVFACAPLISYLSRYLTLEPGDVIMTGTPFGVAMGHPPGLRDRFFLQEGDKVEVEVEGLGRLRNVMRKG